MQVTEVIPLHVPLSQDAADSHPLTTKCSKLTKIRCINRHKLKGLRNSFEVEFVTIDICLRKKLLFPGTLPNESSHCVLPMCFQPLRE